MATAGMAAEGDGAGVNVLDLLAAQTNENARAELVRKHDTLKLKMETLKKERVDQSKQEKQLTAALKQARRAKSRIVHKATSLSTDDIVQILCLKNEKDAKKKAKGSSSSDNADA